MDNTKQNDETATTAEQPAEAVEQNFLQRHIPQGVWGRIAAVAVLAAVLGGAIWAGFYFLGEDPKVTRPVAVGPVAPAVPTSLTGEVILQDCDPGKPHQTVWVKTAGETWTLQFLTPKVMGPAAGDRRVCVDNDDAHDLSDVTIRKEYTIAVTEVSGVCTEGQWSAVVVPLKGQAFTVDLKATGICTPKDTGVVPAREE